MTGAQRAQSPRPNVPTFKELGYDGFDDLYRRQRPAGADGHPPAVIEALNREMVKHEHERPDPRQLVDASYVPGTLSPAEYGAMIDRELAQWGDDRARDRRADQDLIEHVAERAAVTIPKTNFNPPFNITRASHLVFTARDLAAEPRLLHRGDGPDRQRRGRQHDLAARRRGALRTTA